MRLILVVLIAGGAATAQNEAVTTQPGSVVMQSFAAAWAKTCSIPLLNVKPAATPVPMPNAQKPTMLQRLFGKTKPIDRMAIAAPAPDCPAPAFSNAPSKP